MKRLTTLLAFSFLLSVSGKAQNINLDLDLIGHYTFSNSAADSSGNDISAFIKGCEFTEDRMGNALSALRFTGQDDCLLVPKMIELQIPAWSYALWFKPEARASQKSDMFLLSYLNIDTLDDVHLFVDDQNNRFSTYLTQGGVKHATDVRA